VLKVSGIDSNTISTARLLLHGFMSVEPEYLAYKMELTTVEAEGILEAMGWLRKKKPWGTIVYHEFWPGDVKADTKEPRYKIAFDVRIMGKETDYVITLFDKEMEVVSRNFRTWDAGNGVCNLLDVFLQYLNDRE